MTPGPVDPKEARVQPELIVRELQPDDVADYLALFDSAFDDNPGWGGCYCAFYDDTRATFDPEADAGLHRAERAQRIRAGQAHGLLAYRGGQAVGWCNVAPRSRLANLRDYARAIEDPADDPALVMCFVIPPPQRGTGVARALVRGALDAARRWGSPWVEAYPRNPDLPTGDLPASAASYKGPLPLYLSEGFRIARDLGVGYVVRHDLAGG